MVSLTKLFRTLLEDGMDTNPSAVAAWKTNELQKENLLEFPKFNTLISLFEMEKKLVFTPLEKSRPMKALPLINTIKSTYQVQKVKNSSVGSVEVILSPTENFDKVVGFCKDKLA